MIAYVVRCEDGLVRHAEPFARHADAEWGHCCTANHRIEAAS